MISSCVPIDVKTNATEYIAQRRQGAKGETYIFVSLSLAGFTRWCDIFYIRFKWMPLPAKLGV